MCGICGFIDFKKKSNLSILNEMNKTLNHRGPDGEDSLIFEKDKYQIGLAHKRLAIIELTEYGKQPQSYNGLTITYNGEIYNFQEINKELELIGYKIESNSDTETILKAFDAWGEKCLDKFIGMFSFFIYDDKNEEIFIARDRLGVKPLYVYYKDSILLFSSELKAFHKHHSFEKKIDPKALGLFLQYGNVPATHCIFENTFKVLPGNYIKTKLNSFDLSQKKYWNIDNFYCLPSLDISYDEAKEKTLEILKSSCKYRVIADVPIGVFLSGGYDSTIITSILSESQSNINTFTISVPEIKLDESKFAKKISEFFGTNHKEIECSEKEAIDLIKILPFHFDEPFSDSSAIPTTLLSMFAKKDVKVVLSADGGDELFAGYTRYSDYLTFYNKYNKYPKFVLNNVLKSTYLPGISNLLESKIINFDNRREKFAELLENFNETSAYALFNKQFSNNQIKKILKVGYNRPNNLFYDLEFNNELSILKYALLIDAKTYLVDDILTKIDRSTMAASIEGREPLLDHRLFEFAARLPDSFKYKDGIKKYILKYIVHDFIPKELMDRPKMGFAVPIGRWLRNELKEYVDFYLEEVKILKQGVFNYDFIQKIKNDFYNENKNELDSRIWNVLMFQMWYEKWIE